MKEIKGHYEGIGELETYVGHNTLLNNDIILPIYNSLLTNHPLSKHFGIDKTVYLNYGYYIFFGVSKSIKEVHRYYGKDDFRSFTQIDYINTKIPTEGLTDFLLEMVDFNGLYQYWNWKILANSFSLIVDENYILREKPFTRQEMDVSFFERNHLEHLKAILNAEI